MSDVRTLRLASIALTEPLVERFVTYQRVLLTGLAQPGIGDWAGRFAFAHGRAFTESGLDALELQQVRGVVAEFCGRRSAWLRLKQRLTELEGELHHGGQAGDRPDKVQAKLERARRELPRLEDFKDFEDRYGAEALALLRGRELELVNLHQELVRLEGSGGHVHGD